jgi:hypothetical protein
MARARHTAVLAVALLWACAVGTLSGQRPLSPSALRNHPAVGYQTATPHDPVAALNERIRNGEITLAFDPVTGYARSVLDALRIPLSSQVLVFSKTSFQARRISPTNPRALYFSDTVAVGWVRGGEVLEFAAQDPALGTVFYTLEQRPDALPQARREMSCVQCHTWEATLDVPGMFVASVVAATDGWPIYVPSYNIDHRTPFDLRWGGWFVTGAHRLPSHMGNTLLAPGATIDTAITPATIHVDSLAGRFDMTGYASPHSDVVALMVLEHQTRLLNLLTRAGWEARVGAAAAGRPLSEVVGELVDYLLFVDEVPLPGPVDGTSPFAAAFQAEGPRDARGRSLRDLDLRTRLLRYPCSYLVYSEPFDALPEPARNAVYARLWTVLSGADPDPRYRQLSEGDRQAVLEILRATKPNLPPYFAADPAPSASTATGRPRL